jgi:predicted amidophosphoribosyltransferase
MAGTCPHCGESIDEGVATCPHCGRAINEAATEAPAPSMFGSAEPAAPSD